MALNRGSGPSDYIETRKGIHEKEGWLMSDFEILSLVIMLLTLVVAALKDTKK